MEHTTRTYIGAAVVFVLSMAISYFAPLDEIFRGIAAMPAVGSITYVLYQLVRDQAQYEKQIEIQRKQQFFSLGVTSHMASVVFDKHVGFCEAYLEEVDATVATLLQEGPTTEAMNHADNFSKIRRRYATWITSEISSPLIKFEASVRALGATQNLAEQTAGSERHVEQRDRAIDKADKIWIWLALS